MYTFNQAVEALAHGIPVQRVGMKNQNMNPEQEVFHFSLDDYYATDWAAVEPAKG